MEVEVKMRKSAKLMGGVLGVIAIGWVAYPPSREWPGLRDARTLIQTGLELAGLPVPDVFRAASSPTTVNTAAPATKGRGGGAVPITAATAILTDMPVIITAPGSVESIASTGVKTRVDGQIVEIAFKEGDLVTAGQVLFRLDDRLIKAQLRQAEANITKDRAALKDAELNLGRRETLVTKKIVSEAATDTQRSTVEALRASITAGEALLEGQKTLLDYLTIRAPITGRTGAIKTELGVNVRTGDTAALVTINQTQPINVAFAVPQTELAPLRRALAATAKAAVKAAGEKPTEASGRLVFIDNQVDKQTGTVMAKVEVANEGEVFWPGQAVDVSLTVETKTGFIAVPTTAVLPSQQGMISWVIGADNKVQPKTVTLDRITGDLAYVSGGLSAGDRVVTDGQLRLAPGTTVTIREQGAPVPAGKQKKGGEASGKGETQPAQAPAAKTTDRGRS